MIIFAAKSNKALFVTVYFDGVADLPVISNDSVIFITVFEQESVLIV